MFKFIAGALVLGLTMQASAADLCQAGDKKTWKSATELRKHVMAQGVKVKKIKVDDGCYEVYGRDKNGERIEDFYHPISFDLVRKGH